MLRNEPTHVEVKVRRSVRPPCYPGLSHCPTLFMSGTWDTEAGALRTTWDESRDNLGRVGR